MRHTPEIRAAIAVARDVARIEQRLEKRRQDLARALAAANSAEVSPATVRDLAQVTGFSFSRVGELIRWAREQDRQPDG